MIATAVRSAFSLALAMALWCPPAVAHDAVQQGASAVSIAPVTSGSGRSSLPGFGGPFTLIDQTGQQRSDADFHGKMMLVVFGYTDCPDVCPMELQAIAEALDAVGPEISSKVTPIFITVDPHHDTPERLAAFVQQFHPSIIGLTGSDQEIAHVMQAYRVHAISSKANNLEQIAHSSFIYLMSPDGGFLSLIMPGSPSEEIAARLRKYVN